MQDEQFLAAFSTTPRRYKAVYYALTGKQTVSNLLAAREYHLLKNYHLYPKLTQAEFQAALARFVKKGWLQLDQQQALAQLTASGQQAATSARAAWPRHYDYWRMGPWALQWQRLLLAVQAMSNSVHQVHSYQPLTGSYRVQADVRRWWQQLPANARPHFAGELALVLDQLPATVANLLANSLSSASFPGMTSAQLAELVGVKPDLLTLYQVDGLGQLLAELPRLAPRVPQLQALLTLPPTPLPPSMAVTYDLLQQQLPWTTIVGRRRLKENTLKEHLLVAAIILPAFNFQNPTLQGLIQSDPTSFFSEQLKVLADARTEATDD